MTTKEVMQLLPFFDPQKDENKIPTSPSKVQKLKECFENLGGKSESPEASLTSPSASGKSNDTAIASASSLPGNLENLPSDRDEQVSGPGNAPKLHKTESLPTNQHCSAEKSENILELWQRGSFGKGFHPKNSSKYSADMYFQTQRDRPIALKYEKERVMDQLESSISLPDIWELSENESLGSLGLVQLFNEPQPTYNRIDSLLPQQPDNANKKEVEPLKNGSTPEQLQRSPGNCAIDFDVTIKSSSLVFSKNPFAPKINSKKPANQIPRQRFNFRRNSTESTSSSSSSVRPADSSSSAAPKSSSDAALSSDLIKENIQDLLRKKSEKVTLSEKHKEEIIDVLKFLSIDLPANPKKIVLPSISPPPTFNFGNPSSWPAWKNQFVRYLKLSGLDESSFERQLDLFLYLMNGHADKVFKTLPKPPENIEEVLEAFSGFFRTPRNIISDRVRFHSRRQMPGECVDSFLSSLKILAEFCEYGALTNELVRDRFIAGLRNKRVKFHLLKGAEMHLEGLLLAARQAEMQEKMLDAVIQQQLGRGRNFNRTRSFAPSGHNRVGRMFQNRFPCGSGPAPFWRKYVGARAGNRTNVNSECEPRDERTRSCQQNVPGTSIAKENVQSVYYVEVPAFGMPANPLKRKKAKASRVPRDDSDAEDDYGVAENIPTVEEDSQISVEMADVSKSVAHSVLYSHKARGMLASEQPAQERGGVVFGRRRRPRPGRAGVHDGGRGELHGVEAPPGTRCSAGGSVV